MKSAIALSIFALNLSLNPAQAASMPFFSCNNMPEVRPELYYTVSGNIDPQNNLVNVEYGTEKGSQEMEDSNSIEEAAVESAAPDSAERATSRQWKNAIAYDLSSPEFGRATLYIQPEAFQFGKGEVVVRLKLIDRNIDKNLTCYQFGR